jgi:hypothetical protein
MPLRRSPKPLQVMNFTLGSPEPSLDPSYQGLTREVKKRPPEKTPGAVFGSSYDRCYWGGYAPNPAGVTTSTAPLPP